MHPDHILLISDGSPIFPALSGFLEEAGHRVTTSEQTQEALQLLRRGHFRLVITRMSNDWTDTRPFIKAVRGLDPEITVIILRLGPEVRSPVGAYLIKEAGYDFQPFGWPGLRRLVASCLNG